MARTLEEIEALHMQRAIKKGLINPDESQDTEDEEQIEDDLNQDDTGDDAQTRYENEIAQLRQQLSAAQGRVTPAQQQAEEHRRLYETERMARAREQQTMAEQIAALQAQIEANEAATPVEDLLSQEERDMFDPAQLSTITKLADHIAKRRAPRVDVKAAALQVLAEREQAQVEAYRREVLNDPTRGLSALGILANDPSFQEWLTQEENDDFDPLVNSLLNARTEKEIDRYSKAVARRVAKYKNTSVKSPSASRTTDLKPSLSTAMQRKPRQVNEAEIKSQLDEARRLARSRNPADRAKAQAILNKLN